jgi:formylmethanofuran dehydrogenase subunit A
MTTDSPIGGPFTKYPEVMTGSCPSFRKRPSVSATSGNDWSELGA